MLGRVRSAAAADSRMSDGQHKQMRDEFLLRTRVGVSHGGGALAVIHTTAVAKRIHRASSLKGRRRRLHACNERIDLGSNLLLPYSCSLDSFVVYHQYLRNGLPKC